MLTLAREANEEFRFVFAGPFRILPGVSHFLDGQLRDVVRLCAGKPLPGGPSRMRTRRRFTTDAIRFALRPNVLCAIAASLLLAAAPACQSYGSKSAGSEAAGSEKASGSQIDACSLLSAEQAGAALGVSMTQKAVDTSTAGPDAATMCHYSSPSFSQGYMLLASWLKVSDLAKEVDSQKTEIRQDFQKHINVTPKIVDVSDLGDAAFLVEMDGDLQLHAFAKGAVIVVDRNVNATPENIAQVEKFARAALSHLP
jgi:hypothetical protein